MLSVDTHTFVFGAGSLQFVLLHKGDEYCFAYYRLSDIAGCRDTDIVYRVRCVSRYTGVRVYLPGTIMYVR